MVTKESKALRDLQKVTKDFNELMIEFKFDWVYKIESMHIYSRIWNEVREEMHSSFHSFGSNITLLLRRPSLVAILSILSAAHFLTQPTGLQNYVMPRNLCAA